MLKLEVTYVCREGMRDAFYNAIKENGIDQASRAEEGCHQYDYSADEAQPDVLYLKEQWTSEESQKLHTETPHFKRLGEFKKEYVIDTRIEKEII